jgi:hypothetical protein
LIGQIADREGGLGGAPFLIQEDASGSIRRLDEQYMLLITSLGIYAKSSITAYLDAYSTSDLDPPTSAAD